MQRGGSHTGGVARTGEAVSAEGPWERLPSLPLLQSEGKRGPVSVCVRATWLTTCNHVPGPGTLGAPSGSSVSFSRVHPPRSRS